MQARQPITRRRQQLSQPKAAAKPYGGYNAIPRAFHVPLGVPGLISRALVLARRLDKRVEDLFYLEEKP